MEEENGFDYRSKKENLQADVKQDLSILPNPVNNEMSIQLLNSKSGIMEVSINNLEGKLILHQSLDGRSLVTDMNIEKLESGIYVVKIIDNLGQEFLGKFIKN